MKKRKLFNLASCISLVLFIATVCTWARSLRAYDVASFSTAGHRYENTTMLTIMNGKMWYSRVRFGTRPDEVESHKMLLFGAGHEPYIGRPHGKPASFLGFSIVSQPANPGGGRSTWHLAVPFWFITALLTILPTIHFMRRRHEQRRLIVLAGGYCPGCATDLRDCFDPNCPKCGTQRWQTATTIGPVKPAATGS